MADFQELVDALDFLVNQVLEKKFNFTRGLLGDGNGNVDVPGRDGFSYVRPHRGDTRVIQLFNKMVTASDGTPIIIGEIPWLPGLQQVLGVDWETYMTVGWDNRLAGISKHARSHERRDFFVGEDSLNVYTRMMFPLRAEAIGSGTTSITVSPYELSYQGAVKTWPGSPGIDLSPAIPTTTGQARYALVYWDYQSSASPYGALGVASGTLAPISTSTYPPKPAAPAGTIPSAYVYLYYNQGLIKDENIKDARPPFSASSFAVDDIDVSKLVSPDGLIDPVAAADNNGDVTGENDLTLGDTARGNLFANWFDYKLVDPNEGSQFNDNDSSYPDGWTEADAPNDTNTNRIYGFWFVQGQQGENSYKYRIQTGIDVENTTANDFVSFQFGPVFFRDGGYTADIDYYFGMYRDNSGIDENTYSRVHVQWDSATPQWRVRGEESDGSTTHNGTWYVIKSSTDAVLQNPFWIRFLVRNVAAKTTRQYIGSSRIGDTHSLLQDQDPSSAPTWGTVWLQIEQSRSTGIQDRTYIGGWEYLENTA